MRLTFSHGSTDYVLAAAIGGLGLAVRGLMDPILGEQIPYMFSIFAVMVVSAACGLGAMILTVLIGLVGAKYFFIAPRGSLWTDEPVVQLSLLCFVACSVGCAWLGLLLRRYRERFVEGTTRLRQAEAMQAEQSAFQALLHQRQAALEESQNIFQKLIEMVPQFVWMTDRDGSVTYFNQRWYDYTGLTREQSVGGEWLQALHPDDREPTTRCWQNARDAEVVYQIEYRIRGADGRYCWFLGRGEAHRDSTGAVTHWFGTCTDIDTQRRVKDSLDLEVRDRTQQLERANQALRQEIDERRTAEERQRLVARELRRSNEELEKFAYVASHDLQEPLRKIQSFGDRLQSRCAAQLDDSGRDYLGRILGASARMRRLIEDLLSFSRVSTKKATAQLTDLNQVLRDVLIDLEVTIQQSGASVEVSPLPQIYADPFQMQQLFQNLIGNAIKFRKADQLPVIRISGQMVAGFADREQGKSLCELRIADNGIGFDEAYLDRIFQVFQRLHGRTEFEGTGIGLAICRKIAERHGGSITAHSRPGEGATFIVTLPFRALVDQERMTYEERSTPRDHSGRGR